MNLRKLALLCGLSLLMVGMLSTGCSKADNPNDDSSSVKQLMADKPWKIVKLYGKSTAISYWTELNILECNQDNLTTYQENGDMILDYGDVKCNENEPNTVVYGTWELDSDDKKFTTYHQYDNSQVWVSTIEELDDNHFVFYSILRADGGVTNELRYYLEH